MRLSTAVSFALLFSGATLAAQSADHQPPHTTTIFLPPITVGCPVGLRAQQTADGGLLAARNRPTKGTGQGLHLTLTNPDSRQITAAQVTVRGLTAKARVTQTISPQDESSQATKTMEVKFSAGPNNAVSADLWVPGLTAVLAIDLDSVTYADGSSWKLDATTACRTVPDKIMLIGNR
jgi:hypothetical protein